jgi:hypothetical protein
MEESIKYSSLCGARGVAPQRTADGRHLGGDHHPPVSSSLHTRHHYRLHQVCPKASQYGRSSGALTQSRPKQAYRLSFDVHNKNKHHLKPHTQSPTHCTGPVPDARKNGHPLSDLRP